MVMACPGVAAEAMAACGRRRLVEEEFEEEKRRAENGVCKGYLLTSRRGRLCFASAVLRTP